MALQPTRVDTQQLLTVSSQVQSKLDEVIQLLKAHLVVASEEDRPSIPRPKVGFEAAAPGFARALEAYPQLKAAVDFDSEAMREDLANVKALEPIEEKLQVLGRLVSDSRLIWSAEAYVPCLAAYGVAKVKAKTDGELRDRIKPFRAVFATSRERKKDEASDG